jgi:flagellar biosynthesis regulator FlaF
MSDDHKKEKHKKEKHNEIECFEDRHNDSLQDTLLNLMESVAQDENALAHLIRAEADKIQAFVGKHCDFPTKPSNNEIIKLNRSVTQLMETIVMKEWLLLKKLEDTLEFVKKPKKHKED